MTAAPVVFEIIVVSYHSRSQILGLLRNLPPALPVALVDNAQGADGLAELAAGRPNCRYVDTGGDAGFARAANLGVSTSSWDYVVLVNPDSRPGLQALKELVDDVVTDQQCVSSSALNIGPDGRSELGTGGWEPTLRRAVVHAAALHKVFPRSGLFAPTWVRRSSWTGRPAPAWRCTGSGSSTSAASTSATTSTARMSRSEGPSGCPGCTRSCGPTSRSATPAEVPAHRRWR
jgi:hypothetical protein